MNLQPKQLKDKRMDVSIVIVSMNNIKDLFLCLNSIIENTHKATYEIYVVAYLFTAQNLELLKCKYPILRIIESNELRGYSENNNLALRQVKSTYSFILNDDTFFNTPVIDSLVESFIKKPDAAFFSPVIINKGGYQIGRPPANIFSYVIKTLFRLNYYSKNDLKYINKKGIFQTYNVDGCAFMVKTNVIQELGYFNEEYFFCPEDLELSTIANMRGYKCYVNSNDVIHHLRGETFGRISTAVYPAMQKGMLNFYSKYSKCPKTILKLILLIGLLKFWIYWSFQFNEKSGLQKIRYCNAINSIFSNKTPKELFIKYYSALSDQ
jgi:GT2 family glycosyltransferase